MVMIKSRKDYDDAFHQYGEEVVLIVDWKWSMLEFGWWGGIRVWLFAKKTSSSYKYYRLMETEGAERSMHAVWAWM
jgi:hypothetical protein